MTTNQSVSILTQRRWSIFEGGGVQNPASVSNLKILSVGLPLIRGVQNPNSSSQFGAYTLHQSQVNSHLSVIAGRIAMKLHRNTTDCVWSIVTYSRQVGLHQCPSLCTPQYPQPKRWVATKTQFEQNPRYHNLQTIKCLSRPFSVTVDPCLFHK